MMWRVAEITQVTLTIDSSMIEISNRAEKLLYKKSYSSSTAPGPHAFTMESQFSMSQSIFHRDELLLTVQWLGQHFAKRKRSGANEV